MDGFRALVNHQDHQSNLVNLTRNFTINFTYFSSLFQSKRQVEYGSVNNKKIIKLIIKKKTICKIEISDVSDFSMRQIMCGVIVIVIVMTEQNKCVL